MSKTKHNDPTGTVLLVGFLIFVAALVYGGAWLISDAAPTVERSMAEPANSHHNYFAKHPEHNLRDFNNWAKSGKSLSESTTLQESKSELKTQEEMDWMVDHMAGQGSDRQEARAVVETMNDMQREWEQTGRISE